MRASLTGQPVAVITGITGGFGSALAVAFARARFRIYGLYRSAEQQASDLMAEFPGQVQTYCADVGSGSEMADAAGHLRQLWGRADVLVNNAGITRDALLVRQREEDWDAVLRVNLSGAFHAIRAFVPLMQEGGHIVNVSSYSGLKGKEGQAAYSASKAALLGLTRTAAIELGPSGVCVNAVLPGYLPVGMGPRALHAAEAAAHDSFLGSLSDPAEAAGFICNLTRMRGVTGQVLCLDSRPI